LSSDVVFWLYCQGALPADDFGGLWIAHLTSEPVGVVLDMAAPLIAPYDLILGISFVITWSCPGELAALEDFPEVVNCIWDYFHSPRRAAVRTAPLTC
jgi:hypothetical protein